MADLFTHLAVARLPAAFVRDRRIAALVVVGTFLPDLAAKGLYWILRSHSEFTEPTHSFAGILLLSYAAAMFVEEGERRPAFVALLVGGYVHILVDLLKFNFGMGAARPFYPFSMEGIEFGLLDPLNVVPLLPFDLVLLALAWVIERKVRRVRQ